MVGIRSWLDVSAPLFHVCNGPRPGGHYLQFEAWEARECAMDATERAVEIALNARWESWG